MVLPRARALRMLRTGKGTNMTITIHPRDPAAPDATGDAFRRWQGIPSSIAADIAPERLLDPAIRPVGHKAELFGPAFTVRCLGPDFGAVLAAVDLIRPGEVLVIDAGGHDGHAMIGDILCGHLMSRGVAGVVCHGAVRDLAEIRRMDTLAVHARAVNPRGPSGISEGTVGAPVAIGSRVIRCGDLILGDADGLVALPAVDLDTLLPLCKAKLAREAQWRKRLAQGETARAIFGLNDLQEL